jgi:hypothetical protein
MIYNHYIYVYDYMFKVLSLDHVIQNLRSYELVNHMIILFIDNLVSHMILYDS